MRSFAAAWVQLGMALLLSAQACSETSDEPAAFNGSAETTASRAPAAPAGASFAAPTRPACRAGGILVPAARYHMGSPQMQGEEDEHPLHAVALAAYCIDEREVTVAAYRRCVSAPDAERRCSPAGVDTAANCNAGYSDREDHPINCLSWAQAGRYCAWAGARLPSEAEWEHAARGDDRRTYPWGGEPPDASRLNVCGAECIAIHPGRRPMFAASDGFPKTAPVGSFPAGRSAFGLFDMAGNVWEWTSGRHLPYPPSKQSQPSEQSARDPLWRQRARLVVVRGGGWFHVDAERVRAANRHSYPPGEANGHLGVRCAADPLR